MAANYAAHGRTMLQGGLAPQAPPPSAYGAPAGYSAYGGAPPPTGVQPPGAYGGPPSAYGGPPSAYGGPPSAYTGPPPPVAAPAYGSAGGYGAYGGPPPPTAAPAPAAAPPPPAAAPVPVPRPAGPSPAANPDALFAAVDTDRSGSISHVELQRALSSGGWRPFDMRTVAQMIRMFDTDRSGSLGVAEFRQLWGYLGTWKKTFDSIDTDRSGAIDVRELSNALGAMGYRLSPVTIATMVRSYDADGSGTIGFDEFIRMFCDLTLTTNGFARVDVGRRGVVTLSYDDFIRVVFESR